MCVWITIISTERCGSIVYNVLAMSSSGLRNTKLQIMTNDNKQQKLSDNTDSVLPAVFTISSLSGNVTHLGTNKKMPLCGTKLFQPKKTETEIKKINGELKELWKSELQGDKWVIVLEDNYCKRCLSVLNGRQRSSILSGGD